MGRPKSLKRERILEEAVRILDAEGPDALSMRRLAGELGIEAVSLYHHFANKDAILRGVIDTLFAETIAMSPAPSSDHDWRTMMREGILLVRRTMLRHPNAGALLLGTVYNAPDKAEWVETPLRILRDAGFRGPGLINAYHVISAYAFGWHLLAADVTRGVWHDVRTPSGEMPAEALEVTREVGEGLGDWSDGFEEGLDILLDGLEARRKQSSKGE